ncbi:MAG: thymidylate synthase [Desulfobacterales bacterium]|uniref:Thymidylate synthase n=1 Tax=Candidatus Desulfaltia bathyphila TaxID=2841697 RepID=A0A8J6N3Q2_9BACT|nr:thymidylate synthase [Candidatus Desulfaltia bathyphila]MBL7194842.1 thymidylate synthase [Desulfobacterales bacterium]MBL7206926.1 thymidylate synthase [Desulfobacterales bacterium]
MYIHQVEARDLPDLWFQAIHDIFDHGRRFKIDRGSYAGQTRLEYDFFIGHVKHPGTQPLLPDIPPACGIPNPVEEAYIYGGEGYTRSYLEYLMTPDKETGESYTYGERLTGAPLAGNKLAWWKKRDKEIIDVREVDGKAVFEKQGILYINQIEWVIQTYKKHGYRNNQMVLQVAHPSDLTLLDPPCLRSIDTRIQDGALNFMIYFRSWDLWGGLPANLAGIQNLKEYMAGEIGVEDGEMIVESKGLHLYGYAEDLAKLRCMKE